MELLPCSLEQLISAAGPRADLHDALDGAAAVGVPPSLLEQGAALLARLAAIEGMEAAASAEDWARATAAERGPTGAAPVTTWSLPSTGLNTVGRPRQRRLLQRPLAVRS